MNKINDGGPAFPESCNNQIIQGMSLLEAQLAFANATVSALRGQLESTTAERDAAQEREVAYRNALMDAAKDFDQADMGNCCQRVLDELNRIINAAEADHAESV